MFNTSHDILNLVLSVCILSFTVFLCFALYYLIASVRGIYKTIKQIADVAIKIGDLTNYLKKKVSQGNEKINDIFDTVKEKLHNSSSYLMIIGEVLRSIFSFMQNRNNPSTDYEEDAPNSRPKTSRPRK
jgi:predicted PurR-regulated permease PerM